MTVNRTTLASFLLISFIGILFGYWFAEMQVGAVTANGYDTYPMRYFVLTVFKCYLTIVAFFLITEFVMSVISKNRTHSTLVALSFMPLLLPYFQCSVLFAVSSILLFNLLYLISTLRRSDYVLLSRRYGVDLTVLFIFFICHAMMTTRYSPLHWKSAILTAHGYSSEEIPVVVSLFKGFLLSKQYSFANIDHGQWAGVMHPPVSFTSTFLQLVSFIFDVPSVSYDAFHQLVSAIFFILMIGGSFGFYLFLRYGAKISAYFSLLGGYLFMFGGAPFLNQMFTSDGGYFLSSLIAFPYALLAIAYAYTKDDYCYSAWAGIALASQFFMMAPHAEGTIYCLFYYSVFTSGMFFFTTNLSWQKRFNLAAISMLVFLLLSAFYVWPIVIDKLTKNMFVYAHTGDVAYTYYRYFSRYVILLYLFMPLSFLLSYMYKKITPVFLSSILLGLSLIGTTYVVTDQAKVEIMVRFLHLGLHVWCPPRTGVYVYSGAMIIVLYALDIFARFILDTIRILFSRYDTLERRAYDVKV